MAATEQWTTTGECTGANALNIYTNEQPIHLETRSFIYAYDRGFTSQGKDFHNIEATLTSAQNTLTPYYELNQLRPNPSKTQLCAFHLRNRDANRELNVVWNETRLIDTATPVYIGIHLDRTLSCKVHIQKTKMRVNARNNIIRKLANSKWACRATTLRTSCLALCYSAAEYACPVWPRSRHANKLNTALHECCRIITGCLKPANVTSIEAYTCWPELLLLTLGEPLQAAWNANDKRHKPATNSTTM